MYTRAEIYFMTGTGNSFRVAGWFADTARERGIETHVASIEEARPADEVREGGGQLVGLVMPTHGFTAPWYMIKFAWRMPRRRGTHAFVAATRAGAKLGPVFTPGISGSACLLIALVLALKGYDVRGARGLDMPSNWQQVHSGFRPSSVDAILAHTEPRARAFAARIMDGGRHWLVFGTFADLFWGLSMLPMSLLYLPLGRLIFAKMFHASNRCDACGQCERFCPVGGVKLVGEKRPMPYWTYHCESCNRCFAFCPRKAVEISYPWFWILTIVSFVPFVAFWWPPRLASWVITPAGIAVFVAATLAFWYLLAFAGYGLFYLSMRLRWLNTIFVTTNLAHLWRRYRAPGTKLRRIGTRKNSPLARKGSERRRKKETTE